jgi:HTH-type transcriptional regulator/antitoxin HigA
MKNEVKPIRSKKDYEAALAEVERLWGAKSGTAAGDRLDVLATLIDAYEVVQFPMDPPDPIEAIKFRVEQQGLTRKDLEPLIGTRTRVAEVLNRKRSLSIAMIRRLHRALGISAEVLIRPTRGIGPLDVDSKGPSSFRSRRMLRCAKIRVSCPG